jgi:urea transporter
MGILVLFAAFVGACIGAGVGAILAFIIATLRKSNNKDKSWWLGFAGYLSGCVPIGGLIGAFVAASAFMNQIPH